MLSGEAARRGCALPASPSRVALDRAGLEQDLVITVYSKSHNLLSNYFLHFLFLRKTSWMGH